MMGESKINERFFSLSIYVAFFSAMIPGIITGLLLIDIGQTFDVNIGVVSQIRSIAAVLGVVAAVFIGFMSVRFHSKHLLITGTLVLGIVGVGSGLAPSLRLLFLFYALQGLGIGFISPMTSSMIGEFLESKKRSKAMGYLIAAGSASFLISSPIIGFINNSRGWRSAFLFYNIPLILAALYLSNRYLPLSSINNQRKVSYLDGLRNIRKSRSAIGCLIAVMLGSVCWMSFFTFSTSFLRDELGVSVSTASLVMVLTSTIFTVASVSSGNYINRFGKKHVTTIGTLFLGVFTLLYTFSPSLMIGVLISSVGSFFNGFRIPGANSLALEQVPEYRGVMMSLNTAFVNVGNFVGTFIGGYFLIEYGWGMLGVVLGFMGILSSLVYWVFTVDQC